MKNVRFALPLLAVILATASAFTVKATKEIEYYTTDGLHFAEKGAGSCISGSLYCTYTANVENPDLDNPDDFTAQGTAQRVWVQ